MQRARTLRAAQCRRRRSRLREGFADGLSGESSVHRSTRLPGARHCVTSGTSGLRANGGTLCGCSDRDAELAPGPERQECARLRARDFLQYDALTITSMLPGVEKYYLEIHTLSRCGSARFIG